MVNRRSIQVSALKARFASHVVQGNAACIRSKQVSLGKKLSEVRFPANSSKIALGVGMLLANNAGFFCSIVFRYDLGKPSFWDANDWEIYDQFVRHTRRES